MSSGMSAERCLKISREKAQRDEISRLNYARSERLDRGELIGAIKLLSAQLGEPRTLSKFAPRLPLGRLYQVADR